MAIVTLNSQSYIVTQLLRDTKRRASRGDDDGEVRRLTYTADMIARMGIGYSRSNRFTGHGVGGLQDADADTAHPNGTTLPHLAQSVANPDADGSNGTANDTALCAWDTFQGELCGAFVDNVGSDPFEDVRSRLFQAASDTWTGGAHIQGDTGGQQDGVAAFDMTVHKGANYVIIAHENGVASATIEDAEYKTLTQTSPGGSWSNTGAHPGGGTLYLTRAATVTIPPNNGLPCALLLDGPTAARHDLIAAFQEDSGASGGSVDQTRIYHSANSGGSWTTTASVSGKPRGRALWHDIFTAGAPITPVISTTTNVFIIDAANTNAVPILPEGILTGDDDEGFMTVGEDGNLYVATVLGDIIRVTLEGVGTTSRPNIGPSTITLHGGDGLTAARRGPVTWMITSPNFLYVAMQGASNSHIVRWSYATESWHSFYLAGNTNKIYRMAFSTRDDGTPRLHIAVDAGSTITLLQFERPDESLISVTAGTEADGYMNIAEDDLGDPESASVLIEARVDANDLSATNSNEYLEFHYGTDGGSYTATDLGDFLSGDKDLTFGSGVGVSAKTLRSRVEFNRDASVTTDTPALLELEVTVATHLMTLDMWTLVVDLAATAELQSSDNDTEDVIANIEAVRDSVTLVSLTVGQRSAVNVRMVGDSLNVSLDDPGGGDGSGTGRIGGTATFTVEEVL